MCCTLPTLLDDDVLIRVKAVATNPVDVKNMHGMGFSNDRILGYDGAGVVEKLGKHVSAFKVGDEVYFAGDLSRNGSFAELVAVDARTVAKKPKSLTFAQAAAFPLVALTAYEAFYDAAKSAGIKAASKVKLGCSVLIINGAGGVGSITTQLAKRLSGVDKVIATASRPETEAWCKKMGADFVINHRKPLKAQLQKVAGLDEVDVVFCCVDVDLHFDQMVECAAPGGRFLAITVGDAKKVDVSKLFFPKRLTLTFELMFTRPMLKASPQRQGDALAHVARLIDAGTLKQIDNTVINGPLSIASLGKAFDVQASGAAIGKCVVKDCFGDAKKSTPAKRKKYW